ncbi:MAG TPA: zinc ribbon domain-containing protein [Solirubrobacteraceae bacterium]|nr:zinc ribbon domain-containing protein [Solirubrobacteraceae bacterium]
MGILRDTTDGDGLAASSAPTAPLAPLDRAPAPPTGAALAPASAQAHAAAPQSPEAPSELERRREQLAAQVTEMHWDLGGLAYEMAIRDHFRLDVLVRRAAMLQERDAELAEVERLLRMERDGVAGSCPRCTAPHSRGALYCWQCGTTLMERLPSSAAAVDA